MEKKEIEEKERIEQIIGQIDINISAIKHLLDDLIDILPISDKFEHKNNRHDGI